MLLTSQERRCIDLALPVLADLYGGMWAPPDGSTLAKLFPHEKTPKCLVTNGLIRAAIEVKRLTGDEVERAYKEALKSLSRALDPECDGFYVLGPAVPFKVPVDRPLLRHLRREVRKVAPKLARGQTDGVRVPREAWVSLDWAHGPGRVHCCHNYSEHLFDGLASRIAGSFMLVDQQLPDHNFVTAKARADFRSELVAACYRRTHGGSHHFEWYEEIPLLRCDVEGDDERGLDVLAVTEARHVGTAVAEALDYVLEQALKKFQRPRGERWAERHVIVLDKETPSCDAARVKQALSWYSPDELRDIDLILLSDGNDVAIVWSNDGGLQPGDQDASAGSLRSCGRPGDDLNSEASPARPE